MPPGYLLPGIASDPHRQEVQQAAEERITELLDDCHRQHPHVVVRRVTSDQHPVDALREHARPVPGQRPDLNIDSTLTCAVFLRNRLSAPVARPTPVR